MSRSAQEVHETGQVLQLHFSLSLSPLASPVSLHPFTKTDMVQRRNPEKTGARAVHRVPVNRQLQTQCFHTEEDKTCSKSHTDRTCRLFCRKANYQHHWYVGIFQFPNLSITLCLNHTVILICANKRLLRSFSQATIKTTISFLTAPVRLYSFTLLV